MNDRLIFDFEIPPSPQPFHDEVVEIEVNECTAHDNNPSSTVHSLKPPIDVDDEPLQYATRIKLDSSSQTPASKVCYWLLS